MAKYRLAIGEFDKYYLKKFENYVMVNYYHIFDIYSFSDTKGMEEYLLNIDKKPDILLLAHHFQVSPAALKGIASVIKLTEDSEYNEDSSFGIIYKFSHAELIVKKILEIHSSKYDLEAIASERGMQRGGTLVAVVGSSSGGTGKSSIAAALSIMAGKRGIKVLYLNLERIASTNLYFKGTNAKSFSEVIYYLKEKNNNMVFKLEGTYSYDIDMGVSFFAPPDSPFQMDELDADELTRLVEAIKDSKLFNMVVIDMPEGKSTKELLLIKLSRVIVRVCNNDKTSSIKEGIFQEALKKKDIDFHKEYLNKSIFVFNKYTSVSNEINPDDLRNDQRKLFVNTSEGLKFYQGERSILEIDPLFSSSIAKLLDFVTSIEQRHSPPPLR